MNLKRISLFLVLFIFLIFDMFAGPFGIQFGMSLEQIRQISSTPPQNIENDWYRITPPNTHELFETYNVQIHPTFGVYFIQAISRNINTNSHGAELIGQFNNIVSSISRIYGDYFLRDHLNSESIFNRSQDFMFTLQRGDRELVAFWHREEGSTLPDDMLEIIVVAEASSSSRGFIILEYYSINFDKIEEERSSVF